MVVKKRNDNTWDTVEWNGELDRMNIDKYIRNLLELYNKNNWVQDKLFMTIIINVLMAW